MCPTQSYKEQFLLTQRQHKKTRASNSHALTREESLMSIADAICPAAALTGRPETELPDRYATRRGHSVSPDDGSHTLLPSFVVIDDKKKKKKTSKPPYHLRLPSFGQIVTDIAKIIGCQQREDRGRSDCWGNESRCGFGRPVRQHLSALYRYRAERRSRTLALCCADMSFIRLCRCYRRYLQSFTREMRWRLRTTACAPFLGYSS